MMPGSGNVMDIFTGAILRIQLLSPQAMAEREDLANTPAERAAATKAPVLSPIGFFWSKELSPKIRKLAEGTPCSFKMR